MSTDPGPARRVKWLPAIGYKDVAVAAALAIGIAVLFFVDVTNPRGVLDGVGYPAVVALCIHFGRRTLFACAALTSVLIVVAAFLLPDEGISVAGEIANRVFALASVWIIALLLLRRLSLEEALAEKQERTLRFQTSYRDLVRQVLLSDGPFQDRIRRISEIAADVIPVDYVGIYRVVEGENVMRCLDLWSRSDGRHTIQPDYPINPHPEYGPTLGEQLVIAADDVRASPQTESRLAIFEPLGIRAVVAAGVFEDGQRAGQITFGHVGTPRIWKADELGAARALAVLVTLVLTNHKFERALAAFELMSEGVLVEDQSGRAVYANRAAREIAAHDGGDPATAPLWELEFARPPVPLAGNNDLHEITFAGRDLEIERSRLPDGGLIARINDVSARNEATRERARLQLKLQQAAKMEAIGQLAGGVAHDFNNILGSIMGFAGFLVQDLPQQSPERRFAERILSASRRGKELVDQILAFARTRVVDRQLVVLDQVIGQSIELLSGAMPASILFKFDARDENLAVFGSSVQISQLITNLCINARDAIGDKPGEILVQAFAARPAELAELFARPLTPTEILEGDFDSSRVYACIQIRDSGEGIASDALPRIFEPFFTTKGRQRGSGLGLAVVHGVVQSHHGFCHVKTEPGTGTIVSAYLPLADGAFPKNPGTSAASVDDARGSERVLVVDDESDIVDMLAIGLARLGYESVGVNDPCEALAALEEDPEAWDIVVTDQVMPTMRGVEFMRRIKRIRPEIKTVLCTGFSDGVREVDLQYADFYLRKPADSIAVARGIRALVDRPG